MKIIRLERYPRPWGGLGLESTNYFGMSIDAAGNEYQWDSEIDGTLSDVYVSRPGDEGVRWPVRPPPAELAEAVKQALRRNAH